MSEFKKDESRLYRVVKIPSDDAIVINGGTNYGIKVEDQFHIIGKGTMVKDPDTGEPLGELNGEKATVEVTKVFEKMCLCENVERSSAPVFTSMSQILLPFYSPRKSLNVDADEITGYIADDQKSIKIGDKAEHYILIEDEDKIKSDNTDDKSDVPKLSK